MRLFLFLHGCLLSLVSAWVILPLVPQQVPHRRQGGRYAKSSSFSATKMGTSTAIRLAADKHTNTTTAADMAAGDTANNNNNNMRKAAFQEQASQLIRQAAVQAGGCPSLVDIQWKPGRVIVTISDSNAHVRDDDDEEEEDKDVDDVVLDNELFQVGRTNDEEHPKPDDGVNLVQVSRAIHEALDMNEPGSIGYELGLNYEIEVTTPGSPDELSGIMFQSYRGFDVLVEFEDPKTRKRKTIDGRLVERNDEFTVINIKGRMKHIRNDMVVSVKLPKAKKEKNNR